MQRGEEFFIREISENTRENRVFVGMVKNIVEFTEKAKRVLLTDLNGDFIYCLLLDYWSVKLKNISVGYKLVLGPSKILRITEALKSFFPTPNGKNLSGHYFLYDDDVSLNIDSILHVSLLRDARELAYSESSINMQGGILDAFYEAIGKHSVYYIQVIDNSTECPVLLKVKDLNLSFCIGDIIAVNGGICTIDLNSPIIIASQESSVSIISYKAVTPESNFEAYKTIELLQVFHKANTRINIFGESAVYLCLLTSFHNFPSPGLNTSIVYNHHTYYYLISENVITAQWIVIKNPKISENSILVSEKTCVFGYSERMHPVCQIIADHQERLEIVQQEANSKADYFSKIFE